MDERWMSIEAETPWTRATVIVAGSKVLDLRPDDVAVATPSADSAIGPSWIDTRPDHL